MARRKTNDDERQGLRLRVVALESRVRLLERRLKAPGPALPKEVVSPPPAHRPTCPGCSLELPVGKRGQACVWCGFRFDAVPPIPARRNRRKRL
jgi:hypothetical protein